MEGKIKYQDKSRTYFEFDSDLFGIKLKKGKGSKVFVKKLDVELVNSIYGYEITGDLKGEIYLDFKLNKKLLNGFKKVRMFIRKSNKWVLLPTVLIKEKDGEMVYKAKTNCLGVFGVARVEE